MKINDFIQVSKNNQFQVFKMVKNIIETSQIKPG